MATRKAETIPAGQQVTPNRLVIADYSAAARNCYGFHCVRLAANAGIIEIFHTIRNPKVGGALNLWKVKVFTASNLAAIGILTHQRSPGRVWSRAIRFKAYAGRFICNDLYAGSMSQIVCGNFHLLSVIQLLRTVQAEIASPQLIVRVRRRHPDQ
ncbi:hypothetical protein ACO2Q3_12210 [Caulobacter sp. KR2-114]|uniref:hypothetical protein n=1 Tax=Caulobacter sp. KR2-114 TaxID=3400912 RepID=UPI003C0DE0E6